MAQRWYWHIHHDVLVEDLLSGYTTMRDRIEFIKKHKPSNELDLRLKLLHPAKLPKNLRRAIVKWLGGPYDLEKYKNDILTLHAEQCPNCPWHENYKDNDFLIGSIFADGE